MPNWSYNTLVVTGEPADLRAFRHAVKELGPPVHGSKLEPICFRRHLPLPEDVAADRGDGIEGNIQIPASIMWCRENWGTKWNAWFGTLRGSFKSGELTYRFDTAWTPPVAWLEHVATIHRELEFHLTYKEERGHFHGVMAFRNGESVLDEVRSFI